MFTPENAKFLAGFLAESLRREQSITLKVLEAVPNQNLDYKPSEKCMAAFDLAWHIAQADVVIAEGAATGEFNFTPRPDNIKTPADIVAWYKEHSARVYALAAAMTPETCMTIRNPWKVMPLPAVNYLYFATNHTIHHRGQLSSYLRPMGAKVPSIYGGSADEPMSM